MSGVELEDIQRFRDWSPTQFDRKGADCDVDELGEWLVVLGTNRDADTVTRSNWEVAIADCEAQGFEYDTRYHSHWACGWLEVLIVHPRHAVWAGEVLSALADYPLLDDTHHTELEFTEALDAWPGACDDIGREMGLGDATVCALANMPLPEGCETHEGYPHWSPTRDELAAHMAANWEWRKEG